MLVETWGSQPLPAASPAETGPYGHCGGQGGPSPSACGCCVLALGPAASVLRAARPCGAPARASSGLARAAPGQAAVPIG